MPVKPLIAERACDALNNISQCLKGGTQAARLDPYV
jgi:hypothetical protein